MLSHLLSHGTATAPLQESNLCLVETPKVR
jgi:hypothetical protein